MRPYVVSQISINLITIVKSFNNRVYEDINYLPIMAISQHLHNSITMKKSEFTPLCYHKKLRTVNEIRMTQRIGYYY